MNLNRRHFLRVGASAAAALALPRAARAEAQEWRTYELDYQVRLDPARGPAQLWLPLPQTDGEFQRVLSMQYRGPETAAIRHAVHDDISIFHAAWDTPGTAREVQVTVKFATRDRAVRLPAHSSRTQIADDVVPYLQASPSLPTDGIVRDTARRITRGAHSPLEKARAIYDWIVENTYRDPSVKGCGRGDIKSMLETNNLGGKCADLNTLFVGLARAAGVPAREYYGIRVGDAKHFNSLGKHGDISRAQHCRAEFWLAEAGWVPVDPADVRKAVLEEKLALSDPGIAALRSKLFGAWEMNWVGLNRARDTRLAPPTRHALTFFMYPHAETASGPLESHDPDAFGYRITSRLLS